MRKIRVFFTKLGRAKYISHLDSNRCWMRSIKRSGLPVWYTEGFNPHMYLTFPLPLSLGYESVYECVDMRLLEEIPDSEVVARLNDSLPTDIRVFRCAEPVMDQKLIRWADYDILLETEEPARLNEELAAYLSQDEIKVWKKTKKAPKEIDLKPHFKVLSQTAGEEGVLLKLRCTTGIEVNINPSLLLDNFTSTAEIRNTAVRRIMVYNESMESFE